MARPWLGLGWRLGLGRMGLGLLRLGTRLVELGMGLGWMGAVLGLASVLVQPVALGLFAGIYLSEPVEPGPWSLVSGRWRRLEKKVVDESRRAYIGCDCDKRSTRYILYGIECLCVYDLEIIKAHIRLAP